MVDRPHFKKISSVKFDEIFNRLKSAGQIETQVDLADLLGMKKSSISAAKSTGRVPEVWLLTLEARGYRKEWLMTGKGEMTSRYRLGTFSRPNDFVMLPLCDPAMGIGGKMKLSRANHDVWHAFKKTWLDQYGEYIKMVLIRMPDNTLMPSLEAGDIVLVNGNDKQLMPGRFYAIDFAGVVVFRQLVFKNTPMFSDSEGREVPASSTKVIGSVVWSGRSYQ